MEGAIVFAGFMDRSSDGGGSDYVDALSITDETMDAEQFHHRLPFVLRVPVKSQARGIVNVASRISDWDLGVVSAGWIRIQGDLTIVGLSAAGGYHFQCGAQEDGDLFFKESVETVSIEAPPAFDPRSSEVPDDEEVDVEQDFIAANAEADDPDVEYAAEESTTERAQAAGHGADESALGDHLQRLDSASLRHKRIQGSNRLSRWHRSNSKMRSPTSLRLLEQVPERLCLQRVSPTADSGLRLNSRLNRNRRSSVP